MNASARGMGVGRGMTVTCEDEPMKNHNVMHCRIECEAHDVLPQQSQLSRKQQHILGVAYRNVKCDLYGTSWSCDMFNVEKMMDCIAPKQGCTLIRVPPLGQVALCSASGTKRHRVP